MASVDAGSGEAETHELETGDGVILCQELSIDV